MIGVAICTYNPDERLLARALDAVASQTLPPDECVIVDNNSKPPVGSLAIVRTFLERVPVARVVVEPRQGLIFGRIRAIDETTAPILCFFDDDNDPAPDYLETAARILDRYECIGALGPGRIDVEYTDPVPDWFAQRFSHVFQQRDTPGLLYGCAGATWTDYYPAGTGLLVRRAPLQKYRDAAVAGQLSATGHLGASLASGDDTQIVWEAVKMGLAAGVSGDVRVRHLIPSKRASLDYVKRQAYGTSSSYLPALVGSFPGEKARYAGSLPANAAIVRDALKIVARHVIRGRTRFLSIELAAYFGRLAGTMRATGEVRRWIEQCVRWLKLS